MKEASMPESTEIDVKELLEKIDSSEPLMLLDVRNTEEFESWRIEGGAETRTHSHSIF